MSLSFSDTTNKDGVLQFVEQTLGFPDGHISGDSTRLKQWTGSINLALDKAVAAAIRADGRHQFDDSNHTDYPIILMNLKDGQRDYPFTSDQNSNLVLKTHRVFVRRSATDPYYEIMPVDVQSDSEDIITQLADGKNTEGWPDRYDYTANGIFVDPIPPSDVTNGLKVYIQREGSHFSTSDTTKLPGYYGLYHEFLILEACYRYARANNLTNREVLKRDLEDMKEELEDAYSQRHPHDVPVIRAESFNYE